MELAPPNNYDFIYIVTSFGLFAVAAVAEIGGGVSCMAMFEGNKKITYGLIGGIILFVYWDYSNASTVKYW